MQQTQSHNVGQKVAGKLVRDNPLPAWSGEQCRKITELLAKILTRYYSRDCQKTSNTSRPPRHRSKSNYSKVSVIGPMMIRLCFIRKEDRRKTTGPRRSSEEKRFKLSFWIHVYPT